MGQLKFSQVSFIVWHQDDSTRQFTMNRTCEGLRRVWEVNDSSGNLVVQGDSTDKALVFPRKAPECGKGAKSRNRLGFMSVERVAGWPTESVLKGEVATFSIPMAPLLEIRFSILIQKRAPIANRYLVKKKPQVQAWISGLKQEISMRWMADEI